MRILVGIPAISHEQAQKSEMLGSSPFLTMSPFTPSKDRNLDVFKHELHDINVKKLWMVNVPHYPLFECDAQGVGGPGKPNNELFVPKWLEKELAPGKYDKWRPYPASKPLSAYSVDMAKRFSKKRCKMFVKIANGMDWEALFYVEHSPASLAHLDRKTAMEVAEGVVEHAVDVYRNTPGADLVVFSPYGLGTKDGFVVSNRVEAKHVSNWDLMRSYLNGTCKEDPPDGGDGGDRP